MLKLSFLLQAINRVTGPVKEALRSVEQLDRGTVGVSRRVSAAMGAMTERTREALRRMEAPIATVRRAIGEIGETAAASARRVGASMMNMYDFSRDAAAHFRRLAGEDGMARAARSAAYLKGQIGGLVGGFSFLKYASAAAAIGLGEEFVRGVFKAGGEMQTMLVTLTRLEGSASRARQAMAWMQSFAMGPGVNFSMPDIMRSYQMAQNFGMNPQGGSLAAFADLAAGERVSMKQVLYAVKDAMEGTSTRPLANLGIKMRQGRKPGELNSYLYSDAQGRFITEHSEKTPEATLGALLKIIGSKYSGMSTAQAKTVPGGMEQLKKLLYMFEAKVAGSGVLDWALKRMNQFFAYIRQASADGSIDRLAKRISGFMTTAGDKIIGFFRDTNWQSVGADLRLFAVTLGLLAGGLKMIAGIGGGGLSGLFNVYLAVKIVRITRALADLWPVVRAGSIILSGLARVLLALAIAGGPITIAIVVIGALAAAAFLIYRNWSRIKSWWAGLWQSVPASVSTGALLALTAINPLLGAPLLLKRAWDALPGFFSAMWQRIKSMVPAASTLLPFPFNLLAAQLVGIGARAPKVAAPRPGPARATAPYLPGQGPSAAARQWAGKVQLHVTTDPGVSVRTRGVSTNGPAIEVQRGRAMAGAG